MKLLTITLFLLLLASCTRENPALEPPNYSNTGNGSSNTPPPPPPGSKGAILVDASKDGGGWWFPQSPATGFNPAAYHQGTALANYLRGLGYHVEELPRGAVITTALLQSYNRVVRAPAFFPYSQGELTAYDAFINAGGKILLFNDHHLNTTNDALSAQLGLNFQGNQTGTIANFQAHEITQGTSSLPFIAGSYLLEANTDLITTLGTLPVQASGTTTNAVVMGIRKHPQAKIFFLGDVNGLQQVPQPLTSRIIKWLFE